MKVQFASDLHLEFRPPWSAPDLGAWLLRKTDADVIILAGDIAVGSRAVEFAADLAQHHGKPTIVVMGNHEFYGGEFLRRQEALLQAAERHTGVYVLAPGVATVSGVRFVGATLWTDFNLFGQVDQAMDDAFWALADFTQIRIGDRLMTPQDQLMAHQRDRLFLLAELAKPFAGPTVVITHHAPSWGSVASCYRHHELTPAFVSDLGSLVEGCHAALWVHGHTHGCFDYLLGHTRVVCNAGGYPREVNQAMWLPAYRADWVIEVEGLTGGQAVGE